MIVTIVGTLDTQTQGTEYQDEYVHVGSVECWQVFQQNMNSNWQLGHMDTYLTCKWGVHDVFSPSLTLDTDLIVLESVLPDSHSEWFDVIQIHKDALPI